MLENIAGLIYGSLCLGIYLYGSIYFIYLAFKEEPKPKTNVIYRRKSF